MHVFCLYIPHYSAWALGRLLPRRAPVVVVSGGQVIAHAASQHLRNIHVGSRADRVQHLCPEAIVRLRDIGVEQACWDDILCEVNAITPFIDYTQPPFLYFSGADFADVRVLAVRLAAQIGGGEHRSAAQLAAVRSAEGNVIQLRPRRWAAFLRRFDVGHLSQLSFSEDMLMQLQLFGLVTLGDVQRLTERQLTAQFGPEGRRLHAMLHPCTNDRIPLYTPPPFIEEYHEFEDPVAAEPGPLESVMRECIEKASKQLGSYRCQRIRLGIHIAGEEEPRWEGRILSTSRSRPDTLFRLAAPLLQDLLLKLYAAGGYTGRSGGSGGADGDDVETSARNVGGIVIRLESLRAPSVQQITLFDERPAVMGAVRGVHRRYPGMMRRAVMSAHALFEEDEMRLEVAGDGSED